VRAGRYLESGDESWLERVGTFGFEGDARPDRDDRWTGYLAQAHEHYPTAAFKHEHVLWLRALRDLRPRPQLRGFDVDYQPGAGYAHLFEEVGDPALRALAARVPGERIEDEVARLGRLVAAVEAMPASGPQRRLLRTARSLRDGFRYTALVKDAPDLASLAPGMAFRESVMHAQVDDLVDSHPAGARFVVFAHNLHLARDDARVTGRGGVGPGGGSVDSIGTHLAKRHPGRVFSVWMLDGEGRDAQPLVSLGNRVRAPRGSLNAALARAGEAYFVPVRGPLAARHRLAFMYGSRVDVELGANADALYFARRVSPLRGA
jgi:erythromycin esterase-like protein